MRAVVQRVSKASVTINQGITHTIQNGLVIFLGIRQEDEIQDCKKLAEKCAGLRIFEDKEDKMNLSAVDLGYSAMVISNFTLYADTRKGKRPSFIQAAKEPLSVECYEAFLKHMQEQGLRNIVSGEFGADMQVDLINDGPVTIILDTDEWKTKK